MKQTMCFLFPNGPPSKKGEGGDAVKGDAAGIGFGIVRAMVAAMAAFETPAAPSAEWCPTSW